MEDDENKENIKYDNSPPVLLDQMKIFFTFSIILIIF